MNADVIEGFDDSINFNNLRDVMLVNKEPQTAKKDSGKSEQDEEGTQVSKMSTSRRKSSIWGLSELDNQLD